MQVPAPSVLMPLPPSAVAQSACCLLLAAVLASQTIVTSWHRCQQLWNLRLQAQKEYPPSLTDCKDKFLVQSLKIGREVTDVVPELFEPSTGKDIKQSKLRVVLVGPPKPPSPVPEGVEEDPSPVKVRGHRASVDCHCNCDA